MTERDDPYQVPAAEFADRRRRAAGGAIDARDAHLLLSDVVVADNEAAENAAEEKAA